VTSRALPGAPVTCEVVPDRERVVVLVSGELDLLTAPEVRTTLGELLSAGFDKVTVDLSGLTFIDSTGLRLLVTASTQAREHDCEFSLVPGSPGVRRAFEVSGLDTAFTFEPHRLRWTARQLA
jgi:anti-sigma B factor antagonist